jgi:hypothetical protein
MNRFTIGICFGDFERYGFVTNGTWQAWGLLLENAKKPRQDGRCHIRRNHYPQIGALMNLKRVSRNPASINRMSNSGASIG